MTPGVRFGPMETLYDHAFACMETTVHGLAGLVSPPRLVKRASGHVYRSEDQSAKQTIVQKLARLVSTLHVFLSHRPSQDVSTIVQWLKGISSRVLLQEFPHLRKQFWGRHFWARGYLAVSSGSLTDEMVAQYIEEQEGEPVHDDSQFPIDNH